MPKRQSSDKWTHIPANHTLYVNNLNDKLPKNELKIQLYYFFSQFGNVLEIVAQKTSKMRGQAFVVFEDQNCAATALAASKSQAFFGKAMNVAYAKTRSQITVSREKLLENPAKKRKHGHKKRNTVRILVENLPVIAINKYINPLFQEFQGFVNAEFLPSKPGTAWVDFQTREHANTAVEYLQGFELTPKNILRAQYLE